jgi:hypothetical protein
MVHPSKGQNGDMAWPQVKGQECKKARTWATMTAAAPPWPLASATTIAKCRPSARGKKS